MVKNIAQRSTPVIILITAGFAVSQLLSGHVPPLTIQLAGQLVAEDRQTGNSEKPETAPEKPLPKDAGAESVREKDEEKPAPLDLTPHLAMKATDFAKIKVYAWQSVPHGPQTYANVPLQIDGTIFLWGGRNTENGQKYPEKVTGIAVKRKFETLYVYHGAFYEGEAGSPVYEVIFKYVDGTTASNKILNGIDVRDWYAKRTEKVLGPSGRRSVLGWDGDHISGDKKQAVRFCLTAIENPRPELEVETLDLVSSKTKTAGCILAMTTGKSGLIRRPKAEQPKP